MAIAIKCLSLVLDFQLKNLAGTMDVTLWSFFSDVYFLILSSIFDQVAIYWLAILVLHFYSRNAPSRPLSYSGFILAKGTTEVSRIAVTDVCCLEAYGNYVKVHMTMQTLCIRSTFKSLTRKIDPSAFCRVHRSFLVNAKMIRALRCNNGDFSIELMNELIIPVNKKYLKAARKLLSNV